MNILMSIFSPTIFWPIIGAISIGFIVVVIFSIFQDTKIKKQDVGNQRKLIELQEQLGAKEDEINRVKEQSKAKEADYNHQLTRLEEQITENETSRAKIKNLELQLKEKDEAVLKERARRDELEEKLKNVQPDIDKAKKEAGLKTDMYNGLKNQYDELEGQLTSQTKKAEEASEKIKKLEQELKEAKLKLLEAFKHPRPATQEEKPVSAGISDAQITQVPAAQPEPGLNAIDDKKQGLSVSKVYLPQSKPEIIKPEAIDKPKEAAAAPDKKEQDVAKPDNPKKQKPGIRPEAKVRLAQVMQEAAKVAIKKEEKEKPPQGIKEKSGQQENPPGNTQDKPEADKKPPAPEEPKSDNP